MSSDAMLQSLDNMTLVGGQVFPEDIPAIAALGVTIVVNNRPDGEEPGQPANAAVEAAARAAGLDYRFIPVAGGFPPEQVAAMAAAVDEAEGKLLAFCRSGARSAHLWALATGKEIPRA